MNMNDRVTKVPYYVPILFKKIFFLRYTTFNSTKLNTVFSKFNVFKAKNETKSKPKESNLIAELFLMNY